MKGILTFLCLTTVMHNSSNTGIKYYNAIKTVHMSQQLPTLAEMLQEVPVEVESKALDKEGTIRVQHIVGSFIYYV